MNPSLFEDSPSFPRAHLSARLRDLSEQRIWIGGSSWKYEGWIGQVYTRERYLTRGRFSQKTFEASCLAEYAETFPIICADFSFYQFPSGAYWQKLFASAPRSLQFGFKVPEEITVKLWPSHPRYGGRAGLENESFLSPQLLREAFLRPLGPFLRQVALLIFEFGAFPRETFSDLSEFLQELDRFLGALPKDFRYSVEIRNAEFLDPAYFDCLRSHGVAHVFNSWTRMPPIAAQASLAGAFTADFIVSRALLRPGRLYQQAVDKFAPYREVLEPDPETRAALRDLISVARDRQQSAFLFVNNRLEGNAPGTILSIVDD